MDHFLYSLYTYIYIHTHTHTHTHTRIYKPYHYFPSEIFRELNSSGNSLLPHLSSIGLGDLCPNHFLNISQPTIWQSHPLQSSWKGSCTEVKYEPVSQASMSVCMYRIECKCSEAVRIRYKPLWPWSDKLLFNRYPARSSSFALFYKAILNATLCFYGDVLR